MQATAASTLLSRARTFAVQNLTTAPPQPCSLSTQCRADWAVRTSVNKNVKVSLGLPASSYAAPAGGYIDIATVRTKVSDLATAYPSTFGGVMLWWVGAGGVVMQTCGRRNNKGPFVRGAQGQLWVTLKHDAPLQSRCLITQLHPTRTARLQGRGGGRQREGGRHHQLRRRHCCRAALQVRRWLRHRRPAQPHPQPCCQPLAQPLAQPQAPEPIARCIAVAKPQPLTRRVAVAQPQAREPLTCCVAVSLPVIRRLQRLLRHRLLLQDRGLGHLRQPL